MTEDRIAEITRKVADAEAGRVDDALFDATTVRELLDEVVVLKGELTSAVTCIEKRAAMPEGGNERAWLREHGGER